MGKAMMWIGALTCGVVSVALSVITVAIITFVMAVLLKEVGHGALVDAWAAEALVLIKNAL